MTVMRGGYILVAQTSTVGIYLLQVILSLCHAQQKFFLQIGFSQILHACMYDTLTKTGWEEIAFHNICCFIQGPRFFNHPRSHLTWIFSFFRSYPSPRLCHWWEAKDWWQYFASCASDERYWANAVKMKDNIKFCINTDEVFGKMRRKL